MMQKYNQAIEVKVIIYRDFKDGRQSIKLDGQIHYCNNRLMLSLVLDKANNTRNDYAEFFNHEIKKSDIKVAYASLDNINENIGLKLCDKTIFFNNYKFVDNKCIVTATLNAISYEGPKCEMNKFRLSATANDLQGYLNKFNSERKRVEMYPREIIYHQREYVFQHDNERVWIETKEDNIEDLIYLISFFYAVPIECDISIINGKIIRQSPEWNLGEGTWKNCAFSQLFTDTESYDLFWDYLALVDNGKDISNCMKIYIREYVRSQQLDRELQLHFYCRILSQMADVKIKDKSYEKIKNFLKEYKISLQKVNEDFSKEQIIDQDNNTIKNFYSLRNFFEHHWGSDQARDSLKNSRLLVRLELAINIVILNMLGAKDVRFDSKLDQNCIFDSDVKYGHVYERLFNIDKVE